MPVKKRLAMSLYSPYRGCKNWQHNFGRCSCWPTSWQLNFLYSNSVGPVGSGLKGG